MSSLRVLVTVVSFVVLLAGCTGSSEKEINKHKEKPVPPAAEKEPKAEKK